MTDRDDEAWTRLLQAPSMSIADEDNALELVISRARRKVRRRRTITACSLLVIALVVALVAIGHGGGKHSRVETTHHLSVADVTFTIFRRAPTPADTFPNPPHGSHFAIDPAIGPRLAISTTTDRIYVFAARPSPVGEGEAYCVIDVRGDSTASSCASADRLVASGGLPEATSAQGSMPAVFGLVPDFVTRVSYGGRSVPIVNNAFLIRGAGSIDAVVFSTPDGDKKPVSDPTGTSATTIASDASP